MKVVALYLSESDHCDEFHGCAANTTETSDECSLCLKTCHWQQIQCSVFFSILMDSWLVV